MTDFAYIISKILWFPARPGHFALLLGALGLAMIWRGQRFGRWLILACLAFFFVLIATPASQLILLPLEDRFARPAEALTRVDGIVVLGGAVDQNITDARGIPAINGAAERMTETVALARRFPDARIVFTGGQGSLIHGGLTEANVARQFFEDLGLSGPRVIYESAARNTHQNAILTRDMVQPKPDEVWLLITSASHMSRAMGVFRQAGWPGIIAWPVNYRTGHSFAALYDAPFPERLGQFEWGFREWVGLVAYRLMGRTDALLPAP